MVESFLASLSFSALFPLILIVACLGIFLISRFF